MLRRTIASLVCVAHLALPACGASVGDDATSDSVAGQAPNAQSAAAEQDEGLPQDADSPPQDTDSPLDPSQNSDHQNGSGGSASAEPFLTSGASPVACEGTPAEPVVLDPSTDEGNEVSIKYASTVGTQVHVLSVYETRSDHTFDYRPVGSAEVEFNLQGDNVLVLSSYEPTVWTVNLGPSAELKKIITIGYHIQSVIAPPEIAVEAVGYEEGTVGLEEFCGYSLPYNGGGCDTDKLLDEIEALANAEVSTFHGVYRATKFKLAPTCDAPEATSSPK